MPMTETEYVNSLLDSPRCRPIDRDKEYTLFQRFKAGDEKAGNRLVESNLRFVRGVAIGLINRGLTFSELMNEGSIGLRIALSRHNPDQEVNGQRVKFITYAVWWVRQRMMNAIAEQAHAVKLPAGFVGVAKKEERTRRKLDQSLGRAATLDEVAEAARTTVARIQEVLGSLGHTKSLNEPTTPGGDTDSIDLIQGEDEADQAFRDRVSKRTMEAILANLGAVDREILTRSLGLDGRRPETLRAIGDSMGFSHERIRQRRESAAAKLKRPAERMGAG